MISAKQIFLGGGKKAWQNPYVTNGLVAMWDGEWNAGPGVHDQNATTWKNLVAGSSFGDGVVGSSIGVTGTSVGHVWTNDSCRNMSSSGYYYCFGVSASAEAMQSVISSETVASIISSSTLYQNGWNVPFMSKCSVAFARNSDEGVLGYLTFWPNGKWQPWMAGADALYSMSPLTRRSYYSEPFSDKLKLMVNGDGVIYTLGRSNGTTLGVPSSYPLIYGNNTIMDVSCIRLYSRALTASEVAANYAIDKARFNLP